MRRLLVIAALAALCAGCGKGDGIVSVSGTIKLDGKPVEGAEIVFTPIAAEGSVNAGPSSYGVTDAEGRYTLKIIGENSNGAMVGKHKVRVDNHFPPQDSSDDKPVKRAKPKVVIPPKYSKLEAILEFTVPAGGTDKADFDLNSK